MAIYIFLNALLMVVAALMPFMFSGKTEQETLASLGKLGALFAISTTLLNIEFLLGNAPEFIAFIGYVFYGAQAIILVSAMLNFVVNFFMAPPKRGY